MSDSENDDYGVYVSSYYEDAWAADAVQMAGAQMSTKIAPPFNGTQSWFAYEQAIDDWITMTTLDPEKHGPSLRIASQEKQC